MKSILHAITCYALVAFCAFAGTQTANAQIFGGRFARVCRGGVCQRANYNYRAYTAYNVNACANGQCVEYAPGPCASVETVEPCEPVNACEPVETFEPCAPCQAVETVAPCDPVETSTCEICANETICANGVCPRRPVAQALRRVAFAVELARINAARLLRGLNPLNYDASLEQTAIASCNEMARQGRLVHAYGGYEICAYNYNAGIDGAIRQWQASPAHSRLLYGSFTRCGVATVTDRAGRTWFAVRFQ